MATYFRLMPSGEDPSELLDPENQVSTPWGDSDHGPCEKCGASGRVPYRCLSCLERDRPDPGCEACAGRSSWEDACPACEGRGSVTRTVRRGVSVFPTERGLYRYLLEREEELADSFVVELGGRRSEDVDLDADDGALLVLPEEIVGRRPVDSRAVEEIRAHLGGPGPAK